MMNTTNKSQQGQDKRRQILRKRIKGACIVSQVLSFFFMIGIVGGLEHDTMNTEQFIIYSIILICVVAVSVIIYRAMEAKEQ